MSKYCLFIGFHQQHVDLTGLLPTAQTTNPVVPPRRGDHRPATYGFHQVGFDR